MVYELTFAVGKLLEAGIMKILVLAGTISEIFILTDVSSSENTMTNFSK